MNTLQQRFAQLDGVGSQYAARSHRMGLLNAQNPARGGVDAMARTA
jgi:hypothetical protein